MEISIIMPVYNSEKYLSACLESVFHQSFQDFELICINDGSTDHSLDILNHYAEKYKDKMNIISINNGGQANARNVGIDHARGTYVTFADSDDTLKESLLEKLYEKAAAFDADMAICDFLRIFDKEKKITNKFKYDTQLHLEGKVHIAQHPEIICYLHGAPYCKLIKRSFLASNKIEFLKGYIYEDQMFTQKLLSCDPSIVQVPESLYHYYVHDNTTMTSKSSKVTDMFKVYDFIYQAYAEKGLVKKYKKELDYLCLYHVMIGTSYRMWKSTQYSLMQAIRLCSDFTNRYQCSKNNEYLKEKGWGSTMFVRLFYRTQRKKVS